MTTFIRTSTMRALGMFFFLTLYQSFAQGSTANLSAAQIVEKHVAARGGLDAWRGLQTLSLRGKMEVGSGESAARSRNFVRSEMPTAHKKPLSAAPAPDKRLPQRSRFSCPSRSRSSGRACRGSRSSLRVKRQCRSMMGLTVGRCVPTSIAMMSSRSRRTNQIRVAVAGHRRSSGRLCSQGNQGRTRGRGGGRGPRCLQAQAHAEGRHDPAHLDRCEELSGCENGGQPAAHGRPHAHRVDLPARFSRRCKV